MENRENLDKELQEISPFLKEMKQNEAGFRVSEQYFENLERSIFDNLDAIGVRRKAPQKVSWFQNIAQQFSFWRPSRIIAMASVLMLTAMAWYFLKPVYPLATTHQALLDLSHEEAEAYILANVRDFEPSQLLSPEDTHEIPNLLEELNNAPATFDPENSDELLKDFNDEELEDML